MLLILSWQLWVFFKVVWMNALLHHFLIAVVAINVGIVLSFGVMSPWPGFCFCCWHSLCFCWYHCSDEGHHEWRASIGSVIWQGSAVALTISAWFIKIFIVKTSFCSSCAHAKHLLCHVWCREYITQSLHMWFTSTAASLSAQTNEKNNWNQKFCSDCVTMEQCTKTKKNEPSGSMSSRSAWCRDDSCYATQKQCITRKIRVQGDSWLSFFSVCAVHGWQSGYWVNIGANVYRAMVHACLGKKFFFNFNDVMMPIGDVEGTLLSLPSPVLRN